MTLLNSLFYKYFPEGPLKEKIKVFLWYLSLAIKKNDYRIRCFNKIVFSNNISIKSLYILYELDLVQNNYLSKYPLKKGDTVIDCGAYYGLFTLYAAKMVGNSGKVIAFEPDPFNYKNLVANIKYNRLSNVIAIQEGLWSKEDLLDFDACGTQDSSFQNENFTCRTTVRVTTLDTYLDKLGVAKVDFIKMDIEGAEIEALKGASKILLNSPAHLAIATYHIIGNSNTSARVEELLQGFGYQTETPFSEHLTTYAS